jgi:DNA topoisomerase-1
MATDNKLVIVESPTKARTIGRMLGKDYKIMASMGHIRDLPERTLGVDIENKFEPRYEESERGAKIIRELRTAAKKAVNIYLAPDPDREGEAIAWHLKEVLKGQTKGEFHRVTFHEITKNAIDKAFQHASDINMDLVDAQQARRVIDRIVGYKVSPIVRRKVSGGSSAGRVQSVALLLVCEREEKIREFVPEEYWDFTADFQAGGDPFSTKLHKIDGNKFLISNADDAAKALAAIRSGDGFRVGEITTAPKRRHAPPPHTTSTLQQTANSFLKFSATHTMQIAQQLYEGIDTGSGLAGLITYMRTDSVNVAVEAQHACRDFIGQAYGPDYVPPKPNFFKSGKSAQEAHEAIRPTDVTKTPEMMEQYLDRHQLRLYTLIWKRFVASQMKPCEQSQTTVDVTTAGSDGRSYDFRVSALVTVFPGFMKLSESDKSADEKKLEILSRLQKGQSCELVTLENAQKFTEPPPRYSEATLIKELEARGIGRPSTYATIIRTIQVREYVTSEKGTLTPSEIGMKVNQFLRATLPELINVDYTSQMEKELDEVEEGDRLWTDMLDGFYQKFQSWLEQAKERDSIDTDKARPLLERLAKVQWEPAEKVGRRTYDDHKFYHSVLENYQETGRISSRQWQTLLNLGFKYAAQIPELDTILAQCSMPQEELAELRTAFEAREERRRNTTASSEDSARYKQAFDMLKDVKWDDAAGTGGRRKFDDAKFFKSLKKQVESGKILSDKQNMALIKMAGRHRNDVGDFDAFCKLLGLDPENLGDAAGAPPEVQEKFSRIFAMFDAVDWAPPGDGKGRRKKDDGAFFQSLKKQSESGKALSDKQLNVLVRLGHQYQGQIPAYQELCSLLGCEPLAVTPGGAAPDSAAAADPAVTEGKTAAAPTRTESAETAGLLEQLSQVTTWEEPVKSGKFTRDDKEFYQSLKKQSESGKILSSKQVYCLKKMVEKYFAPKE